MLEIAGDGIDPFSFISAFFPLARVKLINLTDRFNGGDLRVRNRTGTLVVSRFYTGEAAYASKL